MTIPLTKMANSPRYSLQKTHIYQLSPSDVVERALEAVRYIAALDLDHASKANNQGFSKSDTKLGHSLSRWPTEIVVAHWAFGLQAIKLARRYRRQLPPRLLVDQPIQTALDI
jgi:hypothetical protein